MTLSRHCPSLYPLKAMTTPADRPTWVAQAGDTFRTVDWFVPPYFPCRTLCDLADIIRSAPPAEKANVLTIALRRLYNPRHLSVMLLARYPCVPPVDHFCAQIREAFEAASFGLMHAAIATLLPVIEGVLRKVANQRGDDLGIGTRKVADEIAKLAERELTRGDGDATRERVDMLTQIEAFTRTRLVVPTKDYMGLDRLNRHGILHGLFTDYGVDQNFHRLVSFLESLVFALSLRMSGVSCFAPPETTESQRLALYFHGLSAAARLRSKLP
jgi:hypothetical protein